MNIKPTYEEYEQRIKELENDREFAAQLLEIVNISDEKIDLISKILFSIKEHTGLEAVGIRLKEEEDFPYWETIGFPADFVQAERYLCARDQSGELIRDSRGNPYLECMCGNVLCGRVNPELPFFTEGGSFWTNSTTELLASTKKEDRQARTRNRCHGEGYESVALIPLRADSQIIGLLQLNDRRKNRFTHEMISFFEKIGASAGVSFKRMQAEAALRDGEERYRALSDATFEAVFISEKGICIEANKTATEMLGYEHDELIGKFGTDFIAPESKELVKNNMLSEYEEPYDAIALRKDGTIFHAEIRGKKMEYKGKKARVTVVHDIDQYKRAAAALQVSEEKFRTLVEYAPFGLSILKPDRKFEYFNPKFTETLGYTLKDIPDKEAWFERARPDENYKGRIRAVWQKDSSQEVNLREVASRIFKVRGKDGQEKIIHFRSVALTGGKQLLCYEDITAQVEAEEALLESEEKLRYLSSSLLTAQERERRRISFELHDELGQALSILKMELKFIENRLRKDQKRLKEVCQNTRQQVDQIIEKIRRLSQALSPAMLEDIGLSAALRWMCRHFTKLTKIDISLDMDNVDNLFSSQTQIIIYRIFQEAFTNIRKHSQATHVEVVIKKRESDVFISVGDNGKGFDMQEVQARKRPQKGLGLTAMEERARILGGLFERFSSKGQGTRVAFTTSFDKGANGQPKSTGLHKPLTSRNCGRE